jgi:MarR family transcriptional regulator for hemolysin
MSDPRASFGIAIADVSRAWRNRLNQRLKPLGLSQAKWLVLLQLMRQREGIVQGELASLLGIEGPTLVRLIDRLESYGLVRRSVAAEDRRRKTVCLTERALPVMKKVEKTVRDLRQEVLADISLRELESGLRLLQKVKDRLEAD